MIEYIRMAFCGGNHIISKQPLSTEQQESFRKQPEISGVTVGREGCISDRSYNHAGVCRIFKL